MPRPFDPALGDEVRALFPGWPSDLADLAAGAGGCAPYLHGLLHAERDWIDDALLAPEEALHSLLDRLHGPDAATKLRMSKRRAALLIALADLGGIWSLDDVTNALTRLAERACQVALEAALLPLLSRGKLPGLGANTVEDGAGLFVLAMGKMGAGELNYSSDIDLICLFDQTRFHPDDVQEARNVFVRVVRAMSKSLSEVTSGGYVFRTDLRLRPDPSVTPVALSMAAAETYYESFGRTWERAAMIKARPAAGDIDAGKRFLDAIQPFIWRKHLDFATIEDAHDIRLAIRDSKGAGRRITLPGHDVKLGRGGIREIEFFTQTRQLIAGGRDASLRHRETLAGLSALAEAGWIKTDTAETLSAHYAFLREVEHRVQMVHDSQTHLLPKTEDGFERLACLMGTERAKLEAQLSATLTQVHEATEGFFAPRDKAQNAVTTLQVDKATKSRWLGYPALRSNRAQTLLDRLLPTFERALEQSARPQEALSALDGFLGRLPAGVQLLSLFEANPTLIDLVLDVVCTSPSLAEHLSRNAEVLDAVIGGHFFAPWPDSAVLGAELRAHLSNAPDYEAKLDAARRWKKEWHFRIGVHLLRGLLSADEAGSHYAQLARVVMREIWPLVVKEFARKHGAPPGPGAVILGMGALGAGSMNAASDLDLIVIYDAGEIEQSSGSRPLPARRYYARLTQALITAVSAPMAEGRLYEVDMRLRPSGNQGPVATSWQAFQTYQQTTAWTWEHMALARASVIAGPPGLSRAVDAFRRDILSLPRDKARLARDVQDMRHRIAEAKPQHSWLDIKAGAGSLQDIELLAQVGTLMAEGVPHRLHDSLAAVPGLSRDDHDLLSKHYQLYRQVHMATRLLGSSAPPTGGGTTFLLTLTEHASLADLQTALKEATCAVDRTITRVLALLSETGDGNGQKG